MFRRASGIAVLTLVPIAAVVTLAMMAGHESWPHLVTYVLPNTLTQTLGLSLGVGLVTLLVGTCSAWLVTKWSAIGNPTASSSNIGIRTLTAT